jgi:hypothetical protein
METLFDQKSRLQQAFDEFDAENPEVWKEFRRIAFELIEKGFKRYGAKAIFEVIRYKKAIETNGSEFKLNNNLAAYYARKFINLYPNHADFFQTRKVKEE